MWKKVMMSIGFAILAGATYAQIGYKGQIIVGASGGVNQTATPVAAMRVGGYVSSHSIVGAAAMLEVAKYNAGAGDSFRVKQWMGNLYYQYALPVGKFIFSPTGGVLLGSETSDIETRRGNLVLYNQQFVYGLAVEFNAEYVLSRHFTIAIEPRLTYLIKTHFDAVKISVSVGVKYYF